MDWLGGLSSIKGQLTNITKDLLAEGTREIKDPETELSVARARITELESVIETQKTEINSIRSRNEDLLVQLESSQLMLDHTKGVFIQQLRDKEAIISKLRSEVSNERGEPEGQPEASLGSTSNHLDISTSKSGMRQYPDLVSEDHQVPSNVSYSNGTATWEELKNEVVQLRAELTKWKKIAKKKERNMANTCSHEVPTMELEREIEQLKQQINELEERRRTELAAVQENHSDHLLNLMGQLKETETEVIRLQKQIDAYESCGISIGQDGRVNASLENTTILRTDQSTSTENNDQIGQESQENLKRSRPVKKKKKKLSPPSTELIDVVETNKPFYCEVSLQTDYNKMKDSSMQATEQVEKKDAFTEEIPHRSICSTSVQAQLLIESSTAEVQTESEYEKTAPISSLTVGTQFSSANCVNSYVSVNVVDASTTSYDLSSRNELPYHQQCPEFFDKSSELGEIVDQLANEMNAYDQVVFNVISRNIPSSPGSFVSQAVRTRQIKVFKDLIKSRHESITKSDLSKNTSGSHVSECVNESSNKTLSIPTSTAGISGEIKETKCQNELPTDSPLNCDEKLQSEFPSSQSKLQDKIQQLEESNVASTHRIAELEDELEPFRRLQKSLSKTVSHLLSLPPPPTLPSHLLDRKTSCAWPPTTVEDQLELLTASEISARNEIIRLNTLLLSLQEKCKQLESDNQQLFSQITKSDENLKSTTYAEDQQISGDFVESSSLAYQLCVSLDPEIGEREWNPDDWEVELFTLLKDRLDSEVTEIADQSESVVKLSAEVVALRDILAQHTTFRTQAERDLKHLLSTIQNQHDMIDKLSIEKQHLETVLSDMKSKLSTSAAPAAVAATTTTTNITTEDDYHKNDVIRIDTQTQTFTNVDKSEEDYGCYYKELIKYICSMYNEFIIIASPNSQSSILLPESYQMNDPNIFNVLKKLNAKLNEYKVNSDNFQTMYNSVVNSLQQKHAESQLYHEKLQRCLIELNETNKRREETEILVNSLREQLNAKQMEIDPIVKQSVSMNESLPTTQNSVDRLQEMHFDGQMSNEERLIAEIERLQAHLVEVEESYTSEAVNAENREVELRGRLAEAEKSLAQLNDSCKSANEQMLTAYSERDEALKHLETSRREVIDLKESLTTLQTVLDNFQRNQEATVAAETEHLRSELNRIIQKETATKQEVEELHKSLLSYQELTKDLHQMKSVNQQLCEQIMRLETKVKKRDTEIDELRERLTKMAVDTDARIDKILIKNLLVSYLQLPANQRYNGIRVIGNLLGFSDEDYLKVNNNSGTLPKLMGWVRTAVSNLPSGPPENVLLSSGNADKSFTELLLAFLEEESSPRSSIKLPTDYYTPEMVSQSTHVRKQVNANISEGDQYSVDKNLVNLASLSNASKPDSTSSPLNHKPVLFMPQQ
ncbi:unnamed protein product [Heterobilharzia americana]|nr:unnamed protein product [Heterobilharzia americana]